MIENLIKKIYQLLICYSYNKLLSIMYWYIRQNFIVKKK